ncbi:amidohydrolase [Sphingomonas sp. AR_OL41]|uniref:amidohydrolase n=1 Tax=Sphingomonas sp. AR_OL41 TaxID=3042729 RepID=UPI0024805D1F|nr:amidohydrolase [Sphingomonas sp. AR_OL41]MDH7974503.1 amidohydrolase [Sphingomonas sp. AR_OL41]
MKALSLSIPTALLCCASSAYAAAPATPAAAAIEASIRHDWPALDALYKDLHANPELGFQERRTAALLAAKMRALGFTVTEGVGGTGIVALYRNGTGPVVMVRTELDALPMQEKTGLPYASQVQATGADGSKSFVAHSCGHDNHMAWWLGTAEALLALKDRWHGTLMFIGQPSEETVQGAKAMIADGLFTRFPKPDYAFAAHIGSAPAGTVSVKDGVVSSNSDAAEVIFHGRGAHGSMPSASIDPIVMGAHFVSDVQSVISRQKEAGTFGVVTVGSFQSGTVGNIIPDTATLKLSLRSFAPDVRALLRDGVTRTANAVAAMAAAPAPEIKWRTGTSAVVNDHALVDKVGAALRAGDTTDSIELVPATVPGWSASEDFSAFVEAGVPGVYFSIGGYDPAVIKAYEAKGEPVPTNHSPYFAPDHDKAIPTGIRTLTLAVLAVAG